MRIKIATEFTTAPGPRYINEGKFSGELFRKEILLPKLREALQSQCCLEVDLDGTAGYGTSFLEESFGGLIREDKLDLETLKKSLKFISTEQPDLLDEINEYIADAHKEANP
jgi:hypothetical protein